MSSRNKYARVASIVILTVPAFGCVDYLNHRDSVTLAAGDAPKANAAIQTIDPWPYWSGEKHIAMDGQYVKKRIDLYTNPPAASSGGPVTVNINQGGGAQ